MKTKNNLIIFSFGAFGYGLLELLWRGHTHWSMLCAGGTALLGLRAIAVHFGRAGLFLKGLLGCGLITGIEYGFGLLLNLILKRNVWDYSDRLLNLNGQICLFYSFLWFLISLVAVPFAGRLNKQLQR